MYVTFLMTPQFFYVNHIDDPNNADSAKKFIEYLSAARPQDVLM